MVPLECQYDRYNWHTLTVVGKEKKKRGKWGGGGKEVGFNYWEAIGSKDRRRYRGHITNLVPCQELKNLFRFTIGTLYSSFSLQIFKVAHMI